MGCVSLNLLYLLLLQYEALCGCFGLTLVECVVRVIGTTSTSMTHASLPLAES